MRGRSVKAVIGGVLLVCATLPAQTSVSAKIRAWIYKKLGIDPKIVQKYTAPKGDQERRHGARVMWVDLRDEHEHLLWACTDCWAPAMANRHDVAVLKDDGLWIIPTGGDPKLAVPAHGLLDVFGRTVDEEDKLLVLRRGPDAGEACPIVLETADWKTGALGRADAGAGCMEGAGELIHRDELWGARRLTSSSRKSPVGPALELRVEDPGSPHEQGARPLTPQLNARDSTRDRFDPIWRNANEVVYLSNP